MSPLRARVRALLADLSPTGGTQPVLPFEEIVSVLRAVDSALDDRSPTDILSDILATGAPGEVKVVLEVVPAPAEHVQILEPELAALLDLDDPETVVVRLDVLAGPRQEGTVHYGADVLDVLQRVDPLLSNTEKWLNQYQLRGGEMHPDEIAYASRQAAADRGEG